MRKLHLLELSQAPTVAEKVKILHAAGIATIPVRIREKIAQVKWKRYQTELPDLKQINEWFSNSKINYAILAGSFYGLTIIDCDSEAAIDWANKNLPFTPWISSSRPGREHRFYKHPPGVEIRNSVKIKIENEKLELDVRGTGGYVIGPGSIHETGSEYKIISALEMINLDGLPELPNHFIDALKGKSRKKQNDFSHSNASLAEKRKDGLSRIHALGYATEGNGGDQLTFKAACILVHDVGLDNLNALETIKEWNQLCKPPWSIYELETKIKNARSYGFGPMTTEWEDIIPLEHSDLPNFPIDSFPNWLKNFALASAEYMEIPLDMAAVFALGAINAATIGRFEIQVNESYCESNCLWLAIILGPGNRKTGAMNLYFEPLKKYEKDLIENYKKTLSSTLAKNEILQSRMTFLKNKAKKNRNDSFDEIQKELTNLKNQVDERTDFPQLLVNDITSEALAEIMEGNSERCSLVSDEAGIFDTIGGRYNNQIPNLDIYLQSYSGSPVKVNRKTSTKKIICLEKPALGITLSPQPITITQLLENDLFRKRGFLGRFLLSIPHSPVGYRKIANPLICAEVQAAFQKRMQEIIIGANYKKDIF